jgi:hypothetical protein
MDDKVKVLLTGARKLLIEAVALIEDYLGIPYDQSYLEQRRWKARKYGG